MTRADELAASIRQTYDELKRTGEYSTEAQSIIGLAGQLADLADRVAGLEGLARTDIGVIIDAVMEGRRPPTVNEMKKLNPREPDGAA